MTTLHVTNGESAAATLRVPGLGGDVLSWDDVLHEGPVPALPPDRLRELRAWFLADCGWASRSEILADLERRDRTLERALAEGRHVVLWFEHDLYDQLQLLQILALVDGASATVELIGADVFLGTLTPEELESLWLPRRPVSAAAVELARLGWEAVRAPEPTAIEAFLARDTSALPFLAAALRRFLEELPDVESGLQRSERQLLEPLVEGPRTPFELFHASQAREEAPFEGDAWAWRRIGDLGAGERPLVARADCGILPIPPPRGDADAFASTPLVITDAGREVLAGVADWIDLLGIDRWLGGTHLQPGLLWRWDRRNGCVVA